MDTPLTLVDLHDQHKPVSSKKLPIASVSSVVALHIAQEAMLTDHTSPIDALLLCVSGKVEYQEANGRTIPLGAGEYCDIPAGVVHRVTGALDSHLLLIR